jgi:hypothetical protein
MPKPGVFLVMVVSAGLFLGLAALGWGSWSGRVRPVDHIFIRNDPEEAHADGGQDAHA